MPSFYYNESTVYDFKFQVGLLGVKFSLILGVFKRVLELCF